MPANPRRAVSGVVRSADPAVRWVAATVVLGFLVAGCTDSPETAPESQPSGQATVSAPESGDPAAIKSAIAARDQAGNADSLGDLVVAKSGSCLLAKDAKQVIWIKPGLSISWIGGSFPATTYAMTAPGGTPASGPVTGPGPISIAIGGSGFLGQTVTISISIDPDKRVAESNESNNVTTVSVTVPATAPQDQLEHAVACQ